VRLSVCHLRCNYCDTAHAFYKGGVMTVEEVVERVLAERCPLVEITGGEPLLQTTSLPLMRRLCDAGLTVLLETSGAVSIEGVDPRVRIILD
jgi:7-carboxy-7-deazaguanine synthase